MDGGDHPRRRLAALDRARSPQDGTWTAETDSVGAIGRGEDGGSRGGAELPAPGGDLGAVRGALDCDVQMSPLTNSMPVLRHAMLAGGPAREFLMAWVAVPALSVVRSRQR